jgi:hypothetical protein
MGANGIEQLRQVKDFRTKDGQRHHKKTLNHLMQKISQTLISPCPLCLE